MYLSPQFKDEDLSTQRVKEVYECMARFIWKLYEKTNYPSFLERLNPNFNKFLNDFLIEQETRLHVRQHVNINHNYRNEIRNIINEVEKEKEI